MQRNLQHFKKFENYLECLLFISLLDFTPSALPLYPSTQYSIFKKKLFKLTASLDIYVYFYPCCLKP